MQRVVACARAITAGAFFLVLARANALAIPVFANGQGVSCETCHTTFPGMTPYGMMVMMTNFQTLNRIHQQEAFPLAVRVYITSLFANNDTPGQTTVSDLSYLSGGFIGKNFTYYAEQHTVDDSTIGATEQLWLSWNGLFGGTNSLQVGKFHTPFPFMPAHKWTIADYLLATQTTGQNDFNPNDARWGYAFNGMSNEFMYNLSYLTSSAPLGDALDFNSTKNGPSLDFNISYGGMSEPWSVGLVGIRGFAPLHDAGGAFFGSDAFTREGIYYGYQTAKWHLQAMYYHGFDAHPDIDESNVSLNGAMFEVERDFGWRDHVVVRYDVASSDTLNRQYALDVSHNIQPNLALVAQALSVPNQRPQFSLQLAFAGPYIPNRRYLWKAPVGVAVVPATAVVSPTAQNAEAAALGDANAGAKLVQENGCSGCHGASFQGGLGPKLYGIERQLSATQIGEFIKNPRAPMPNFGFSDEQIADIVAYLAQLDGGGSGLGPTIALDPPVPADRATVYVTFPGTPPADAAVMAIMQMGTSSHHTPLTPLQKTDKPNVLSARVDFSMGGPWTIEVQYEGKKIDMPINVNG